MVQLVHSHNVLAFSSIVRLVWLRVQRVTFGGNIRQSQSNARCGVWPRPGKYVVQVNLVRQVQ